MKDAIIYAKNVRCNEYYIALMMNDVKSNKNGENEEQKTIYLRSSNLK
jgi:hypothetical protein